MTTYADPTRCPDCSARLLQSPEVCQVCALPLTGPTAHELYSTLQQADQLLGTLRRQKAPLPVPGAPEPGSLLTGIAPYPAPRTLDLDAPRLRGASVPQILLTLGALCLLVAAVTFLAVAWSWLGVGGRTVVLVALTATALGLSRALHRRALRMASEALSVVGLGLLALDVVGARHSGWMGTIDDAYVALASAAVVATGALLMVASTARRPLVAPALIAPVAVLIGGLGAQLEVDSLLPLVMTVMTLLGLGRVGILIRSRPLQVTSLATGCLGWLLLVLAAVTSFEGLPLTLAHYAGRAAGWPLVAVTVLAAAAGPVAGVRRGVALCGYAVAGLVGTYTVLMPVLDNEPTAIVSAMLAASVVWASVLLVAPSSLRPAALPPLVGTLLVPVVAAVELAGQAVRAVLSVGAPFSQPFGVHVATASTWVSPLLLVPTLVTLTATGCAGVQLVHPVRRTGWAFSLAMALVIGAAVTLPLYDVPLAAVVGMVLLAAVGGLIAAERLGGAHVDLYRLGVLVLTLSAALLALPSDRMTTVVLAVACAMAGYLMTRTNVTGSVAALCFPVAFGGLVWAGGSVAGVDEQLRAVPVLLVLEAFAIWRPRTELEGSSAIVATVVSAASIVAAHDLNVALAVYLTIAGVLVTVSSIVHPSRRLLAWPGGFLLAAATWVRLFDLGVHVPEAYALPSALVLVVIGGWRLRQNDASATLTLLAPGLTLATVPPLLAVLDDPVSPRALLLGAACLAIVLAGVRLRWSAPLVVGSVVGSLLVLRELTPYAAAVPPWLLIGLSGTLLTVVGVTWESRMRDLRSASRYVGALR